MAKSGGISRLAALTFIDFHPHIIKKFEMFGKPQMQKNPKKRDLQFGIWGDPRAVSQGFDPGDAGKRPDVRAVSHHAVFNGGPLADGDAVQKDAVSKDA